MITFELRYGMIGMGFYLPDWADLWFIVTIVVPVVLPSLGAAFLRVAPGSSVKIMPTVSDGQLGWVVVAAGASGVYEALDLMNKAAGLDVGTVFAAIGFMFVGVAIAITGSGTPAQQFDWSGKTWRDWASNYRVFVVSLALTILAAANFTALHHKVQELHEATQHRKCPDPVKHVASPLPSMVPLLNCKGP
jgi:hypothetical protein